MKILQYEQSCTDDRLTYPEYYSHFYPEGRLLFFDIETTGFSADHTTLYLIGALWYEKDTIRIVQWLNDDGYGERDLLDAFHRLCKEFTHLVHFNGLGFDLPYLNRKAELLNVPFDIENSLEQIDIYKEMRSYRTLLGLESMKQTAIERFMGVDRMDTYSGKELIHLYQRYVTTKDPELERTLLLHNHDDLLGMPRISQILCYRSFFENPSILSLNIERESDQVILSFTVASFTGPPHRLSLSQQGIYLNVLEQSAILYIPILSTTLKHYFSDYKNYYYLPAEDMAIHKSVAAFVEPERRQKAKKDTCYIKKDGQFIPCPDPDFKERFQISCSDKPLYQTIESLEQGTYEAQQIYIKKTLQIFL
ncbi:MAG: ribonuclease H-like domain-containing protein [Lachnospiraceae bacterium]|nr:ribonuclease H-like domain-containing protein [Lachnospiraceae bacterium]